MHPLKLASSAQGKRGWLALDLELASGVIWGALVGQVQDKIRGVQWSTSRDQSCFHLSGRQKLTSRNQWKHSLSKSTAVASREWLQGWEVDGDTPGIHRFDDRRQVIAAAASPGIVLNVASIQVRALVSASFCELDCFDPLWSMIGTVLIWFWLWLSPSKARIEPNWILDTGGSS